jgi:hypothetical protein
VSASAAAVQRTHLSWVPAALLLHVAEEAWAAPVMLAQMAAVGTQMTGETMALPSGPRMVALLAGLVLLSYGVLQWARRSSAGLYALIALQTVLALNVLSHTAGTVLTGAYSPGLVTAWLVQAPLSVVIARRLRAEPWMTPLRRWTLVPVAVLIHGPLLRLALGAAARL